MTGAPDNTLSGRPFKEKFTPDPVTHEAVPLGGHPKVKLSTEDYTEWRRQCGDRFILDFRCMHQGKHPTASAISRHVDSIAVESHIELDATLDKPAVAPAAKMIPPIMAASPEPILQIRPMILSNKDSREREVLL